MGLLLEVTATVRTDQNEMRMFDSGQRTMIVQIPGDWEGNALKTQAGLDRLFAEVAADMRRQLDAMNASMEETAAALREQDDAERRERSRGRPGR
jgi:hypothetical protein